MQHILVTGGAGVLGCLVVKHLSEAGYPVRGMSRQARPAGDWPGAEWVQADLETGEGIEAAVEETEIIVHCAGSNKGDEDKTRNLVQAASQVGVRHLVYISVVGADRIPVKSFVDRTMFGYFASKLAAEHIVAESGLPWTTLRATQFHYLTLQVARSMAKLPVVPHLAGFQFQPIDEAEVAARLAELALGTPSGLVPDMGGPKVYTMAELLRGYMQASHQQRPMIPLWLPGKAAHAVRAGANLAPEQAAGSRTWEAFLTDQLNHKQEDLEGLPGRTAAFVKREQV